MDTVEYVAFFENSTPPENVPRFDCGLNPHEYLEIKLLLISVIGTLIGCFGIFGNVSTVLILTRSSMRNPNNMFLATLAIFDTCLLITAFSIYGMEYIIEYLQALNLYIVWLTYLRFAFALSHISQTGSVYTTVAMTVERFIAVCYPRLSKRFCTLRNTVYSIAGVITFAVMFNSTKFFEIVSEPNCSDVMDWQSFHLFPSAMAMNEVYIEVYSLWLTNIVMVFFPFIILLTLNAVIAYTIRKSLKVLANRKHIEKELITVYGCCDITVRLPDHDKFAIWRQIARRRWLSKRTRRGTLVNEVRHLSLNDFATAFIHSISDNSLHTYLQSQLTRLDGENLNNNHRNIPKQNGVHEELYENGFLIHKEMPSTSLISDILVEEFNDSEIIFV